MDWFDWFVQSTSKAVGWVRDNNKLQQICVAASAQITSFPGWRRFRASLPRHTTAICLSFARSIIHIAGEALAWLIAFLFCVICGQCLHQQQITTNNLCGCFGTNHQFSWEMLKTYIILARIHLSPNFFISTYSQNPFSPPPPPPVQKYQKHLLAPDFYYNFNRP